MDFEALQAARESCRVYSDRPVPRETLAHLVDVARLAPSGCNAQPWRFIIIDEPEARAKLIEALDDDGLDAEELAWEASSLVSEQPASRPQSKAALTRSERIRF